MNQRRVGILISGGGSNMVALVRSMHRDHPATPAIVISNDPGAAGLGKAADLGVATATVDHREFADRHAFETEISRHLDSAQADLICLAGFMRILSETFVNKWAGRCLNIHPSLLPEFRGLNTHQRALEAGAKTHGCTVHEVTRALDDGPILGQARVPIEDRDTAQSLAARVIEQEHILYPAVLARYAANNRKQIFLG